MGVEYLKYDNCGSEGITQVEQAGRHRAMRDALIHAKHPILFALCEWNGHVGSPYAWVNTTGNSWRTGGDIAPHWDGVLYEIDNADRSEDGVPLWPYTGPNTGWGDADMLEVGVCVNCAGEPGEHPQFLSSQEAAAHFSLWSLVKSPLLAALDPTNATKDAVSILTNKMVISISQDPMGAQGRRVHHTLLSASPEPSDPVSLIPCQGSAAPTRSQNWAWDWPVSLVNA